MVLRVGGNKLHIELSKTKYSTPIKDLNLLFFILLFFCSSLNTIAQSFSPTVNYQGRISIKEEGSDVPFDGSVGYFKFAIINYDGSVSYWSNDNTSSDGNEPENSVTVPFNFGNGTFSLALGGGNMEPLTTSVFNNFNSYLRVWFSKDNIKFNQLKPNEKLHTVPFSFRSEISNSLTPKSLVAGQLSDEFLGLTMASNDPQDSKLISLGFRRFGQINSQPWIDAGKDDAPLPLTGHTAVINQNDSVSESVVYVWGGTPGKGLYSNQGWSYDSNGNFWKLLTSVDNPSARRGHTAVWAGQSMIIWGGEGVNGHLADGGIYNSETLLWEPIEKRKLQDFSARRNHTAIWTGKEMIIWGGRNEFDLLNDGSAYNPAKDTWRKVSSNHNLSKRSLHTSIWTGSKMILWGGTGESNSGQISAMNDGAIYDPTNDKWISVSGENAPSERSNHTAVWTGDSMIVWGGRSNNSLLGDGYIYFIESNRWEKLPTINGPEPRVNHSATWTGTEMIIFGGTASAGEVNTGYAYNIKKDKWRAITSSGSPTKRTAHTALWTGSNLWVFGGVSDGIPLSKTQRLNVQSTWYLYRKN